MKSILVPFYLLFCSAPLPAQIKTGMTFQAVVYHNDGRLLALKPIGIRFSFIREGTTLYSETHRPTTTLNGLFSVIIGTGTPVIGSYMRMSPGNWVLSGSNGNMMWKGVPIM